VCHLSMPYVNNTTTCTNIDRKLIVVAVLNQQ